MAASRRSPRGWLKTLEGCWHVLNTPWTRRGLAIAFFALGAWLIWRELRTISWSEFRHALVTTAPWKVAASIGLALASYACLSMTEWLSVRALGHRLGYRDAVMVAVPAYALTNSAGFSPATGTAFRLQLYSRHGVKAKPAALIALVAGAAVTLSGPVTAGLAMLAMPAWVAAAARAPVWGAFALGLVLLIPAAVWFFAFTRRAPKWLRGPKPGELGVCWRSVGLAAGVGDWVFSCAALFVLLPNPHPLLFPGYLVAYIAGSLLSAASGVPGGIGVFEAIVLGLTTLMAKTHETATALVLYRCIYSLGPLMIWGAVTLARKGIRARSSPPSRRGRPAARRTAGRDSGSRSSPAPSSR